MIAVFSLKFAVMVIEFVILQAAIPFRRNFLTIFLVDLLDVKSELSWKLVNVINRAGGVDLFWKISKNIKKRNNSKLRFLKSIKLDE